jgi:hypothetical protein
LEELFTDGLSGEIVLVRISGHDDSDILLLSVNVTGGQSAVQSEKFLKNRQFALISLTKILLLQ